MHGLLDNVFWHALVGPHARYAAGAGAARRYAPGFSPIVAFADAEQPDFTALAPWCEAGEHFYCAQWRGPPPDGWRIDAESTMFRMVWTGPAPQPPDLPEAAPLGPQHAAQAVELAALTHPGPFGPRTIELGDYFGVFDGARLVAMAGERSHAGALREISGVCTHPDQQGRGWARRLMLKLIDRQLRRGETPFLHVMRDNENAHRLYRRMGFEVHQEPVVRVVSRLAPESALHDASIR
jgi:ribosomal protein S18 acetylase RimI-like enzyme